VQVETTGETVGEAKWAALRELERRAPGLDKGAVRFQVVSEGERGLLGVGYAPARVVATVEASAVPTAGPGPERGETEQAAAARELAERVIRALGVDGRIEVEETDDAIGVTCVGHELGVLIGRHGQTIDAIQYLANAIGWRSFEGERKDVVIDAAGYRDRRRATLEQLAVESAERATRDGERIELEPMTAVDRKVVHLRLKEYPGVETTSEGAEPNRFVVVLPTE
jgi:spoIIIJ-associated protein